MSVPGQTTLLALRTLIRQRCNMERSQAVTDPEINSYINGSNQELYGLLIQAFSNNYYVATPYQFTTDGVNYLYALPPDFFKLLGTDLSINAGANQYLTVKPFNMPRRNRLNNPYMPTVFGPAAYEYQISGNNIWFAPMPQGGLTVQLIYAPRCVPLVNDADILDGVNGWEEYVVVDVCIKILAKLGLDISVFATQKQVQFQRIQDEASNRDAGIAHTVTDGIFGYPWEMG